MDAIELKQLKGPQNIFSKPVSNIHSFYLYGVESAENYTEWFEIIRSAPETDIVKLHINSYGGDLFAAIQFIRALQESSATIVASVEGACMSAATMIFLQADYFEISNHSMFMFHNYSGGTIGKGGEMMDQLKHERTWSEKMMREVYADFLTTKEIESILDNKDIWMDGIEVAARLEKKAKKVKKSHAASSAQKPEKTLIPEA